MGEKMYGYRKGDTRETIALRRPEKVIATVRNDEKVIEEFISYYNWRYICNEELDEDCGYVDHLRKLMGKRLILDTSFEIGGTEFENEERDIRFPDLCFKDVAVYHTEKCVKCTKSTTEWKEVGHCEKCNAYKKWLGEL